MAPICMSYFLKFFIEIAELVGIVSVWADVKEEDILPSKLIISVKIINLALIYNV